ncbi:hypothetical protein MRX96_014229 [Rhipicephalus microplus]
MHAAKTHKGKKDERTEDWARRGEEGARNERTHRRAGRDGTTAGGGVSSRQEKQPCQLAHRASRFLSP